MLGFLLSLTLRMHIIIFIFIKRQPHFTPRVFDYFIFVKIHVTTGEERGRTACRVSWGMIQHLEVIHQYPHELASIWNLCDGRGQETSVETRYSAEKNLD